MCVYVVEKKLIKWLSLENLIKNWSIYSMRFIKFILVLFLCFSFSSCNVDFLNLDSPSKNHLISSNELFNEITVGLSLPKFKSLNEDELLDVYAIDPKILVDYVANIPSENI